MNAIIFNNDCHYISTALLDIINNALKRTEHKFIRTKTVSGSFFVFACVPANKQQIQIKSTQRRNILRGFT